MAFDVIQPNKMGSGAIATTATTLFTVEALGLGILKTIDLSNTGISTRRVTLYLVPDGDSPSDSNTLIPNVRIMGGGMFQWSGSQVLNEGDSVVAVASATGVTYHGSGGKAR